MEYSDSLVMFHDENSPVYMSFDSAATTQQALELGNGVIREQLEENIYDVPGD